MSFVCLCKTYQVWAASHCGHGGQTCRIWHFYVVLVERVFILSPLLAAFVTHTDNKHCHPQLEKISPQVCFLLSAVAQALKSSSLSLCKQSDRKRRGEERKANLFITWNSFTGTITIMLDILTTLIAIVNSGLVSVERSSASVLGLFSHRS